MVALIVVVGFFVLLAVASLAGLGADSRDPEVSLFRAPHEGRPVIRRHVRARY